MIQFKNVTKKYGKEVIALDDVSFSVDKGAFVYLVGPTGSGKTTVFRLVIRDLVPDAGEVLIGDINVSKLSGSKIPKLRRTVGTIFQDLKLLMDRTVMENVILPLQFTGVHEKTAKKQAEEILLQVGLADKKDKFPLQLSGGERQRVAIARALIFNPEILLADEPTGNLDSETSYQIIDLLQSINKLGTTILMTTHNKEIIDNAKQRVITVDKGRIAHDKPSEHKKTEEVKHEVSPEKDADAKDHKDKEKKETDETP
ncbi:MAG TPA: cell division ATP-binding protein FtsE [Candidatus Levybacteria bacterium]|nr:cell division ATP-binding protein FtsE [Candidatus Levybacteria bacterium]